MYCKIARFYAYLFPETNLFLIESNYLIPSSQNFEIGLTAFYFSCVLSSKLYTDFLL